MTSPMPPAPALVGVFPFDQVDAVRRVAADHGVPPSSVTVGDDLDARTSLRAEQVEEARESWTAPQAGVALPKETAKALSISVPIASLVGAIVLLPFAFIPVE